MPAVSTPLSPCALQWGAWTMMLPFLDVIKTITDRMVDYDFVINLSDADIALRTNEEILRFLRPYRGRNLVQIHMGEGEWLTKARNFTSSHVLVECGGYGELRPCACTSVRAARVEAHSASTTARANPALLPCHRPALSPRRARAARAVPQAPRPHRQASLPSTRA